MCPGDETVGAFVSGELAGASRSDFEHHLGSCATCRELVSALGRRPASPVPERDKLGRYQIESILGAGGMGVVYRANDPELGRRVALKVVRPHGDVEHQTQARARLVREARSMAKIAHPNVIVVHDAGSVGDEVFIAMELVDGANLADWERAAPRPWREIIDVYLQAARGLAAAHRAGLVHRDFKPHNALIAGDGRVRVLDFGLARSTDDCAAGDAPAPTSMATTVLDAFDASAPTLPAPALTPSRQASADTTLTRTGAIMGSPQFMSPEQHRGERADARSDQFSYCVTLYHALYGSYPYAGVTYAALAAAVIEGEATPAPRTTKVPLALGRVLARGLRRAPADRFATMDELVGALTTASRGRRTRWIIAATLAVVAALAATVIVLATRSHPSSSAPIAMAFSRNQQIISTGGELVATPDLSPDGNGLAFATEHGLVVRDLATGATHEVSDLGRISGIRWAPTSDRLVVATDNGPVVVPALGGAPKLFPLDTSTCRAAWSPDASEILFGCDGEFGWRIVTVASGAVRKISIALPANDSPADFDWSPSGIVIATSSSGNVGKGVLWKVRADGTDLVRLSDDELTNCVRWNARGDRVYAGRLATLGTEVVYREFHADKVGPPVTVLVQPLAAFSANDTFALSHDERDLIYVQRREWSDVMLTLTGATPRALTADRMPKQALAIMPDGKSITYASGELEHMAIYRQPLAGGAAAKISAPERFYLHSAASPDGTHVIATSLEKSKLRTSVISLADGSSRDLEHPLANFWWPVEWNALGIVLLADSDKNFIVIDPVTGVARMLWPTNGEVPLFNSALSPDGREIALNLPVPGGSSLAVMRVADRSIRILSGVSAQTPLAWSPDGTTIFTLEKHEHDGQRIVAFNAASPTSKLVGIGGKGSWPSALPDGSGIVQVIKPVTTDLWLASIAPRAALPAGPPTPPAPPPTPPPFHPAPVNLALTGATGAAPDGWVAAGGAVVSASCGGPSSCAELDAKTGAAISEYIDATPYRGRRVTIEFDARVDNKAVLYLGMNSGVYARTELPAGRIGVDDPKWTHHQVTADIAPDSVYVKLKAMTDGAGRAWIANVSLK